MKKILALLAVVLGVVSCQTEPEGLDVNVGGEQEVAVCVSLPEATRANDDSALGAFANVDLGDENDTKTIRYILKIYQKVGDNYVASNDRQVEYSDGTNVVFPVRLVPNRDYRFVVWADYVESKDDTDLHYNTADLANITLNGEWKPMDETRDAFTGYFDTVEKGKQYTSTSSINIELKRPFAKLRVITTDMKELGYLGIKPTHATVEYTSEYRPGFNALTSEAFDAGTVKKSHSTVFPIKDYSDFVGTANEETHKVLFTDYFFAEQDVVKFTLNVYEDAAGQKLIKSNEFSTDIFVRRNYLTTIQGNILTDGNNVTVEVKDAFVNGSDWNPNDDKYDVEIVEVGNAADLQQVIEEAQVPTTVVLGGDIDLGDLLSAGILSTRATEPTYGLLIPADKEVVLDLKGYTISQTKTQTTAYSMIDNRGTLIIKDSSEAKTGKLNYTDNGQGGEYVSNTLHNSGVLTIEGGIVENNSSATVAANGYPHPIDNSGTLTIKGGTFTNNANYSSMRIWCTTDDDTIVTINGGTFNGSIDFQTPSAAANKGTLTITGGTFNADTYTNCAVRLLGFGADVDEMNGYISGGQFNGAIALKNWSGSELNSKVFNITGGTFTVDPSEFVDDDYAVVKNNGEFTLVQKEEAVEINGTKYRSIKKAVAAAQNGETVKFINDVEQADGVIITDKNIIIDLNNKTFTVTEGANTNNRNFKVNGSSVVTIKNGTMVAQGDITSGAYGTLRTEDTANVTLEDVVLYSYRGYGLNVKVCTGTTVTINNSEINSQYGGGVEAAGGTVVLNNVTIDQEGVYSGAAWCSVAIGVNGNGKVTVNSGNYYASAISTDANAAQGTWVAYVMSSGGTLDIKGGTFNGVVAETAAAANACGLICADRAAVVEIHGGTFNSNGAILDMRNNVGTQPNPKATLFGGTFSADPRVSGLYSSNLITVAEGYVVVENNGVYTVGLPEALVNFLADIAKGGEVTLSDDITLLEPVVIEGKEVVLDLNGKTVTAPLFSAFEVKNGAELTIKNGKVVAYESTVRAIGGKATIESGEYTSTGTALDSPATYRYSLDCREGGELIINGGTFKSNNGMINVGSIVTINGGKFENIVEKSMTRHFAYVSAPLTINDGEFFGKANGGAGGCFFCGAAASGDIQVNGGKFTSLWTSGSVNRIFEVYFGGTINVTGGMFNTNGGIATFVTENTDEATKAAYPYVAK